MVFIRRSSTQGNEFALSPFRTYKKKEQEKLPIENKSEINKQKFKQTFQKVNQKRQSYLSSSSDNEGCKDPFFSEFFNGSNLSKALEIFNPRATAIDLDGFVIKAGLIGQTALISVTLSGSIQPKGTYVISNVSADSSILHVADMIINDSTLLSTVQITLEDSTGRIYDKIGSTQLIEWITMSLPFYANHSFVRDYNVSHGDTNWVAAQQTWNAISQNNFSNLHRHINVCSPLSNSITFEFDNFIISNSGGNDYAEFDIMATSSTGAYIENAPFWVGYSNSAFTPNVVANNAITVTRGATFGNSYEDPQTSIWDSLPNMFIVGITDDISAGSWNRPYISNTPVQVLHFKIKIANCNQNVSFNFLEQATSSFVTLGCPTATENAITGNYYFFDNVYYTDLTNAFIPSCTIYISKINGSTTNASCIGGDINNSASELIIEGGHFGNNIGKVYMKNSNDGGQSWVKLDDYDIVPQWSDNQIKVKVPSTIVGSLMTPGSGEVRVVNTNGDSTTTSPLVKVGYSLYNYWAYVNSSTNFKNRYVVAGIDTSHTIKFRLNAALDAIPNARGCVKKALKDWSCSTGINWHLDTLTTTLDSIYQDSISVIGFGNISSALTLANTGIRGSFCANNNLYNQISTVNEPDIIFNNSHINDFHFDSTFTESIPTGKYDFYHVILHELGHASLLYHTNNTGSILWYNVPSGQAANQRVVFIDSDNMDGGLDVMLKSTNTNYSACTNIIPMTVSVTSNCSGTSGNRYITNNPFNELEIFPNPVNDMLNIKYSLAANAKTNISIYNSTGQLIKEVSNNQTIGTYTLTIDTKQFANGIYYIRFFEGVNSKQAKFIVQ
ncbi:MAG: T9SS type A sorting domain-containing protein [Bacteroidia bacterium]|nr:T9SS type A sorting domain-containing protein [Bacteroidia bacterium]MCZ2249969.1 T9SS type A sorting domain-containing protein [Bacteroidia bacterium]